MLGLPVKLREESICRRIRRFPDQAIQIRLQCKYVGQAVCESFLGERILHWFRSVRVKLEVMSLSSRWGVTHVNARNNYINSVIPDAHARGPLREAF